MRLLLFALPLLACSAKLSQAGDTWADRLAYPSGTRVLILYADHMGAAYETNQAGKTLLSQGLVGSAGVMVPCAWFEDFAEWCRAHRDHDMEGNHAAVFRSGRRANRMILGKIEST